MTDQTGQDVRAWGRAVGADALLRAVGQLSPDRAFFVVDGERTVIHWSEGAERLLGYTPEQAEGHHCLKTNRCVACIQACGISTHGTVLDVPLTLFDVEGAEVPVLKNAQAFFDDEGTFLGGIEVLRPAPTTGSVQSAGGHAGTHRPRIEHRSDFHGIVTVDPHLRDLFQTIQHVAETEGTVLVRGESGTGKELVARAIHAESHRSKGPFVAINCAALSAGLLESELFGHVRGAFTGAVKDRAGVFSRANGGTLFLDEVAELPVDLQAKLLRVLQEQRFVPVGGTRPVQVDVRIVAATNRSLRTEVKEGRFREDLMYRLRVIPLYLPPLRERIGDIELLLWTFLERQAERGAREISGISPEAMRALLDHRWPGNIRELINVVEYAVAVGRGSTLSLRDLPPEFREQHASGRSSAPAPPADEKTRMIQALDASGGHIGKAAEMLGISRPTFWRKRKKYGI